MGLPAGIQPDPPEHARSGAARSRSPRELSFTAALQKIAAAWAIASVCDEAMLQHLVEVHLDGMAKNRIGDRPDRVEPRAVKRRPKTQKLLKEPRAQARAKLLRGVSE